MIGLVKADENRRGEESDDGSLEQLTSTGSMILWLLRQQEELRFGDDNDDIGAFFYAKEQRAAVAAFGEIPRVGTSERRRIRAGMLPARQPIARLGWMIVCRDTERLLQVGKGGHAGLAVELRLLHSVGEGEPEGLDELLPVLVVPKCQLRLYKVNWDRHAVSKSGRKEENTGEV